MGIATEKANHTMAGFAEPGQQPQQRGRVDQPQVTMDALRDLFREELQMAVGQLNDKVGRLEAAMQAQHVDTKEILPECICVYKWHGHSPENHPFAAD